MEFFIDLDTCRIRLNPFSDDRTSKIPQDIFLFSINEILRQWGYFASRDVNKVELLIDFDVLLCISASRHRNPPQGVVDILSHPWRQYKRTNSYRFSLALNFEEYASQFS
ncbi:hypothetical protein V1477_000527 [Vespula maculifrons]|uniref:Uncharacterized protein n=1 Tax=Vespula maculifrons TaxID=7453 RepID=A0ABD2D343_VESMC